MPSRSRLAHEDKTRSMPTEGGTGRGFTGRPSALRPTDLDAAAGSRAETEVAGAADRIVGRRPGGVRKASGRREVEAVVTQARKRCGSIW